MKSTSEFQRAQELRRAAEEIAVRAGMLQRCDSCGYAFVDFGGRRGDALRLADRLRANRDPLVTRFSDGSRRVERFIDEVVADADATCHCHPLDVGD